MAFSRLLQIKVTVGGNATIPTELQDQITYDGEIYTLNARHRVGFFEDGSPFVVSDAAGQIAATSIPSATLNGAAANGMMKNPAWTAGGIEQGFDGFFGDYPPQSIYEMAYNPALNVDPGASNAAVWGAGEKASFVKSFRHPSKTSNSVQFQTVSKYHVITVLDQAPPLGTVRPAMSGMTKPLRQVPTGYTGRGHSLPASWPPASTIIANVEDNLAVFTDNLIDIRFLRLTPDVGTADDGYSAKFVDSHAQFIYAMNSNAVTQAERDLMVAKSVVFGNDVEGLLDLGWTFGEAVDGGAGQCGGLFCWVMAAAALTDDAAMMAKVRGKTQVDYDQFWITAAEVGIDIPIASNKTGQTYFAEQIGMPWSEPDELTSAWGRYTNIGANIAAWETLAILSFPSGPSGYANGAVMMLNGGAENNPSNAYGATLAFCARVRTWEPWTTWSYGVGQSWRDGWDQAVGWGEFTPWTGKPDQPPHWTNSTFDDGCYFSAGTGSGEVLMDIGVVADGYATETITSRDFRYSLDGYQWIEEAGITLVSDRYTKTGLLQGATYWCGWRQVSASGASVWSPNYPESSSYTEGGDRHRATTTGTPVSAAPVWSGGVAPKIVRRRFPAWDYPKECEQTPAALTSGDEVFCGVGHVSSAHPAPSYSYQWKRNGANIAGATLKGYTVAGVDSGTILSCEIMASNGSGSDVTTTAGLAVA